MGTLALQQGGAAIGGAYGGPLGAAAGGALGSLAGQYLFREKPQESFGPRLGDDETTDSTEGRDVPIVWGDNRLAGHIIWQGPRIEKKHKEDIGGKGGPTATHVTYTYRRSFAVDFGAFESAAILRIWLNKELVYDVRPTAVGMRKAGLAFTAYLGTETQEPDPTIESYVGVGNVSAHRGHTLIVFENYDVTQLGGRSPNVEAELLTAATQGAESVTIDCNTQATAMDVMHWDSFNKLLYVCCTGDVPAGTDDAICAIIDPFSRTLVKLVDHGPGNRSHCLPFTSVDAIEFNAGINDRVAIYGRNTFGVYDTSSFQLLSSFDPGTDPLQWMVETRNVLALNYNGVFRAWPKTGTTFHAQTLPAGYTNELPQWGSVNNTWLIKVLKKTATGEFAGCRYDASSLGGAAATVNDWGEDVADWVIQGIAHDTINDHLWCLVNAVSGGDSSLFKIDFEGALTAQVDLGDIGTPLTTSGYWPLYFDEVTKSLYIHETTDLYIFDVTTETLTTKTIIHQSSWSVYIPELGEIWCGDPDNAGRAEVYGDAINRVDPDKVAVADIITDICAMAGIPASSLDVTQVTQQTNGYRHSRRVAARGDLEPLMTAYHIDAVQSDYKLKFVPRGGSIVATIDSDLLGAHPQGSTPPALIEHTYAQGVDYPNSVDLHYRSVEADLQPGLARSAWYANDAEHQETLTLPLVMDDDDAAELADAYLQLIAEKDSFRWATPRYYAHLEPTDCVNLPVNGENVRVRITRATRGADGLHQWECELDDPSDLTSYAIAGGAGVDSQTVELFSPPQLIVVDGPLLRDIDNDQPGPYIAAFTRSAGFPGAAIYVSADGANYIQSNSVESESSLGKIATVPVTVILDDWDDTNTLSVEMINGTLATITEAEVLAGGNAMLWGAPGRWEAIQPATCTFVSGTTYNLTHILRGRRGTDWAMELHGADDWLIVADDQTLRRLVLSNQDIGAQRWIKLPAVGTAPADANATLITVGDVPLMPYSAIELEGTFDGTGCTLDWLRRTRKGGAYGGAGSLVDGVGGSVSEDSESYEIDIFTYSDTSTPVRTLTATTNSKLYAIADMTTDGVPAAGPFLAKVYQMSTVAGRGYPAAAFLVDSFYDAMFAGATLYWQLDETSGTTAADETAGGYDGTIGGSVALNQTGLAGTGTSFGFSASGEDVYKSGEAAFDLGDEWTVVLWISPTTAASERNFFKIRTSQDKITLRMNSSDQVEAKVRDASGAEQGPLTSSALTSGTAYSVILTHDGTTVRLYIDGVAVESLSVTGSSWSGGNPNVRAGDSNCGDVDEVAFYKRTFTQAEIDVILSLA